MTDEAFTPRGYDPLSTRVLTETICRQFEMQELVPLDVEPPQFLGAGLYALYYIGDSVELYRPLVPYKIPVYAGQAQSTSSASGFDVREPRPLWKRISDHRRSILGGGLPIGEFACRLLRLPDVHIDLGENGLRVGYKPVWNAILKGFGSHEQGSSTRQSARSMWDTVHAGRARTYGATRHDAADLTERASAHIQWQIENYPNLPWHSATP